MKIILKFFTIPVLCVMMVLSACKKDADEETEVINLNGGKAAGQDANNLLSSGTYTSMTLEINYMPGYKPDDASINNLKNFLSSLLNKPGGITVNTKQIEGQAGRSLSGQEIADIETNKRSSASTSGSVITVYLLFTDGEYAGNQGSSKILGVAYKSTSLAVFGKTISMHSGGVGQVSKIILEGTVLEHEFGHLLGLVDNGTTMQNDHADNSHGKHCENSSCLMYYETESTSITSRIGSTIPELDDDCKADLIGNGGK